MPFWTKQLDVCVTPFATVANEFHIYPIGLKVAAPRCGGLVLFGVVVLEVVAVDAVVVVVVVVIVVGRGGLMPAINFSAFIPVACKATFVPPLPVTWQWNPRKWSRSSVWKLILKEKMR